MESSNWINVFINGTDDDASHPTTNISTILRTFSHVLHEYQHDQLIVTETRNLVLVTLYVVSFLIATSANTLALLAFCRYQHMRQLPNTLLITLAIADLLVALVCMPMAVGTYTYRLWIFGELMCKLSHYLQGVAVTASIFTMTVMSLDRYVVICHPITSRRKFCRRHMRWTVLVVWILAAAVFIPIFMVRTTRGVSFSSETFFVFCIENWQSVQSRRAFGTTSFILVFFTPGLVMTFAYFRIGIRLCERKELCTEPRTLSKSYSSRPNTSFRLHTIIEKRRLVAKRFVILTTVFAVCWVPYNLVSFLLDFQINSQVDEVLSDFLPFGLFLGHVNSAINPILYCWLNRRFRWCLIHTLKCETCRDALLPHRRNRKFRIEEDRQVHGTILTLSSQSNKQKSFRTETFCSTTL